MGKKITNQVMLITYADSLGNNFKDLKEVLEKYYEGAVCGLHVLPFFPSSGDRGFAPLTYDEVDPAFGDWDDVRELTEKYYMMCDYMINHMSAHSPVYQDFLEKHEKSEYADFFINWNKFWGGEPSREDFEKLYLRKKVPYIQAHFADGTTENMWTTFSDEQIDIDCLHSRRAKEYLKESLQKLSDRGMALIRTDAMAYAAKRPGTNCFFVEPEMWELLDECREALEGRDTVVLPEIHEHCFMQKKLEERGTYTYDFQIPLLILNAVLFGRTLYLKNWIAGCSKKRFTTLDTHDGIGVVDARYLMPDEDVMDTQKKIYELHPEIREIMEKRLGKITFSKFGTYQISGTYYDLLGEDDETYLMARAVQFFTPGIPMVYYVGLFAGKGDYEFYSRSNAPRDINRHYYSLAEIDEEMKRPVVQKMRRLMIFRNTHPAFNGDMKVLDTNGHALGIRWQQGGEWTELMADFEALHFEIAYTENGTVKTFE